MKNWNSNFIVATLLVFAAAVSRVVMYPDNFSPIIGMAIFAGAVFTNKKYAFALPLAAMLLSDIIFEVSGIANGFWGWGQLVGYAILGLITVLAFSLKKLSVVNIAAFSIASSVIFFLLSNGSVWAFGGGVPYEYSFAGLMKCYTMGLPFFRTGLIADLVYSFILFGGYYLLTNKALFAKRIA